MPEASRVLGPINWMPRMGIKDNNSKSTSRKILDCSIQTAVNSCFRSFLVALTSITDPSVSVCGLCHSGSLLFCASDWQWSQKNPYYVHHALISGLSIYVQERFKLNQLNSICLLHKKHS